MTQSNEPMDLADALKDPAGFVAGMTETVTVHRNAPGPSPGPWTLAPNGTSVWDTHPVRPNRVCEVIAWPLKTEANAALIVAAPDLLAALVACEDRLCREGTAKAWPEIEAARAAIRKATGEE